MDVRAIVVRLEWLRRELSTKVDHDDHLSMIGSQLMISPSLSANDACERDEQNISNTHIQIETKNETKFRQPQPCGGIDKHRVPGKDSTPWSRQVRTKHTSSYWHPLGPPGGCRPGSQRAPGAPVASTSRALRNYGRGTRAAADIRPARHAASAGCASRGYRRGLSAASSAAPAPACA